MTSYNITIVGYKSNTTIPFSIAGTQCKYGDITYMDSIGTANLTASYNDTVFFTGGRFRYFCIPLLPIQYHMECIKGPYHPICTLTVRTMAMARCCSIVG